MKFLIALIIILILILAIIISIYVAYRKIRRKLRSLSLAAFNTPSLTQGAAQMRTQMSTTPKSVSGMTHLLLPKISQDFPDFNYNEMRERANNVLTSYLRAITNKQVSILQDGNEEIQNQLVNHIEMQNARGAHEHFDQIRLHETEIHQYRKHDGKYIITFQSSLECYHYITGSGNQVLEGSKDFKYQTKYNVDMVYIQDRNLIKNDYDNALGLNCPNCGAPISSLNAKFCDYCGTGIVEINIRAWSFCNVEEIN